jgi:hypothetical protein
MRARSFKILALLLLASLTLSSCAKLPTGSEVRVGSDIQSELSTDYLYYSPSDPIEGAGQQTIMDGFLNAATGPQNDYEVARKYLSEDLASKWNPSAELLVGDSRPVINLSELNDATVTFKAAARVDELGRYQQLVPSITRTMKFAFVEENGEWRISEAPDTTVLVRPVFDVLVQELLAFLL